MLLVGLLGWWYSSGWRDAADRLSARLNNIYESFSVPLLVATMFEPWRRIITPPGTSLPDHAKALLDNLVSRAVGGCVRLLTLITAGIVLGATILVGGALLLLWPLLPLAGPILMIWGLLP